MEMWNMCLSVMPDLSTKFEIFISSVCKRALPISAQSCIAIRPENMRKCNNDLKWVENKNKNSTWKKKFKFSFRNL